MLHIYTGTGKGKTTAAAGLSARAAGWGKRVVFAQFLKGTPSGETRSLKTLGVRVIRDESCKKFLFQMTPEEKSAYQEIQQWIFREACAAAGSADLLTLDEVGDAVSTGMIEEERLLDFLGAAPAELEIVLTGRGFSEQMLAAADYISEISSVRHPYDKGTPARKGVEF